MDAACSSKQSDRHPLFRTSIETLFANWEALKLAVVHGQGGRYGEDIAKWMVGAVEDFFYTNDDLMGDEVADFIGEMMCQEMDTMCEDNSLIEIGERLILCFKLCKENKEDELNKELQEIATSKHTGMGRASVPMQTQSSSSSSSSEDDDSEAKKESSDSSDWDMDD